MALELEIRTFLRRTPEGRYRLETTEGDLILQRDGYRQLRRDLPGVLVARSINPARVKILIGAPPRPRTDPPPVRLRVHSEQPSPVA